jgi:hypothetical protein
MKLEMLRREPAAADLMRLYVFSSSRSVIVFDITDPPSASIVFIFVLFGNNIVKATHETPPNRFQVTHGPDRCGPTEPTVAFSLPHPGRITAGPTEIFPHLADRVGLAPDDTPYMVVARSARALSWTRDPFDHLITAAAIASNRPLLTRDKTIRHHYPAAPAFFGRHLTKAGPSLTLLS